jgi:hypothetical protein
MMASDLERVLRGLEEAREFARRYQFEITHEYRALIERVERMPRNQAGCDKSSVWPAMRRYVESFTHVRRARRG